MFLSWTHKMKGKYQTKLWIHSITTYISGVQPLAAAPWVEPTCGSYVQKKASEDLSFNLLIATFLITGHSKYYYFLPN